jgi:L-fucose mutarotase
MLRQRLTHPEILEALAAAGHGARVLLADGNFPASTILGENSALVYLNLAPGKPRVTEVLDVLLTAIPVEEAVVMEPEDESEPAVFQEFRRLLPAMELQKVGRMEFYEEVASPDTCLVIMTGEQRLYANVLLTIGVVAAD